MKTNKVEKLKNMHFENENQQNCAIELATLLDMLGLTQRELAQKAGVSLATITNQFRPAYGSPLTINSILKISNQTEYPEDTYNKLMDAAGHDRYRYPYRIDQIDPLDLSVRTTTVGLDRDTSIIFRFIDKIQNDYDKTVVLGQLSGRGIPRLAFIDYSNSDMPISEWNIEFHTGFGFPAPTVHEFFYRILKEGKTKVKYSFITNSQQVYDELTSFTTNIIEGIYISVILCKDGTFTEAYVTPNHTELDKAGLSL